MKVHCTIGTEQKYQIKLRELTCNCKYCLGDAPDGEKCHNEQYVGNWKTVLLDVEHPIEQETPNSPSVDDLLASILLANPTTSMYITLIQCNLSTINTF